VLILFGSFIGDAIAPFNNMLKWDSTNLIFNTQRGKFSPTESHTISFSLERNKVDGSVDFTWFILIIVPSAL
jgi:hypothetical protein